MIRHALISVLLTSIAACEPGGESEASVMAEPDISYQCGEDGYLATELFGALDSELHWSAADLACEGMPRPNGDGARLRFAGSASDGRQLAFIIALPELRRGETGTEYQSNVTIIEEGDAARFFSTADSGICWTDITGLESRGDSGADYAISGTLYCVAPLTQVNGDSDVLIRDLEFRGLLDWNAS
jgi:hypothetical protein